MIINSKPLSYVSTEDIEEPLTPSHLIIGRRVLSLPNTVSYCDEDDEVDLSHEGLEWRLKHLNKTLDHFWKRWKSEYFIQLRECHRYSKGTDTPDKIRSGDIVVVHDEHHPRGFWKLAKVENLIKGSDKHARGAVICTHSKGAKMTVLRHPLQRLYPLEISCKTTGETKDVKDPRNGSGEKKHQDSVSPGVKRDAARQAERWLKTVIDEQ